MLVLDVSDTDICCLKLVALHLQAGKVLSDITPFQAAHVEESLMEVGLCVYALHSEGSGDSIPLLLSCWEFIHIHGSLNGEMLAKEALGNDIFAVPVFVLPLLNVSDVVRVLGDRTCFRAIEIVPTAGKYHRSSKVERKCCPVCTFRIEVWNIGRYSDWWDRRDGWHGCGSWRRHFLDGSCGHGGKDGRQCRR